MMYLFCETALHAGAGRTLGSVDLPIQRERTTQWPMIQASGIKGPLRAIAAAKQLARLSAVFGPETENASDHAGALGIGDARLLLFPVRTLQGVFAWVTCHAVFARFLREFSWTGIAGAPALFDAPPDGQAFVGSNDRISIGKEVVLEDAAFEKQAKPWVDTVATWLMNHALPTTAPYAYWRNSLASRLVIVSDTIFTDLTLTATEIQTHIKLDPDRKTVQSGALWTAEYLPTDSLLYTALSAYASREIVGAQTPRMTADEVIGSVRGMGLTHIQLGGDETTGHGIVALRIQD
jgi:CRISPR-associated protein Cmr4